jgi:hypothetical protein
MIETPSEYIEPGVWTLNGTKVTLSLRALAVSTTSVLASTMSNSAVWIRNQVSIIAAGTSESASEVCEGAMPLVSWSDEDNGTLTVTGNCSEAVQVDLEVFNESGDVLFWSQTALNNGTTSQSVSDVRTLLSNNQQVGYRAWHMCAPADAQSSSDFFKCGAITEAVFAGESEGGDTAAPTTTVSPSEEAEPQGVPVGLLTPVATNSDGGAAPETPVAQVVVDPAVTILVCEQDCVDKIADRTGIDEGLVEIRLDGGEWEPALGGIIPVGDGAVSVEFRATPFEGEAVILGADFKGGGSSIRDMSTVRPSGEVIDSTGEVVSIVPVYETVTTDGLPWRNIIIGVVLLLLIALVVISMLKRKQRRASSVDDSASKV